MKNRFLMKILGIVLGLILLPSVSYGQTTPAQNPSAETSKTEIKKVAPTQTKAKNVEANKVDEQKSEANKSTQVTTNAKFDAEKEQRLEELRYKHLWIAYSLVWLIVFAFMFSTWKRGQAVEDRLDELKQRLAQLENKN